jgi:adenine-specific DNA-methyltransferase
VRALPGDYRNRRRAVEKLPLARTLRLRATDAEQRLWYFLRNRQWEGAKFRRQHEFGPYILDFFCPTHRLVIEVDGSQHLTEAALAADVERTRYLETRGLRVLRFDDYQVLTETERVMEVIHAALATTPSP